MKITVNINNVPTEITLTDEQIDSINKQKKFEFNYKSNTYFIGTVGTIGMSFNISSAESKNLEHGRYRLTEDGARNSLARNKRANRLEALAEHLGGLMEFKANIDNYHIYFDAGIQIYNSTSLIWIFDPEKVYMTKECAVEICRMLNNNEFSLDGN